MQRLLTILLWSAISAAFIGPGTVTTAAAAGAKHGLQLVWALVFSTLACLSLQEAAGRLTVVSGRSLGEVVRARFGRAVAWAVVGSVVLGCAAYEAGNILGAVVGASLGVSLGPGTLTLLCGALAVGILFAGQATRVARLIGIAVALMGVAFVAAAILLGPSPGDLARGGLVPSLPRGSGPLVLGLIGTTVVPYNLFLGSGLARGQRLSDIRLGLAVAVPLGGLISVAVLITGTAVTGRFGLPAVGDALSLKLGAWAGVLFAVGLFAAGLSSAVTAPLASALAVRSLARESDTAWHEQGMRFRTVWITVTAVGLGFGLSGVQPVPVIILAQALNGLVLPFVAVLLLIATNDRALMGEVGLNGWLANSCLGLSCAVAVLLGAFMLARAGMAALGWAAVDTRRVLLAAAAVTVGLSVPVWFAIRRSRRAAG
jgi:Mn2+/Fe2+ NRAMP family transporter